MHTTHTPTIHSHNTVAPPLTPPRYSLTHHPPAQHSHPHSHSLLVRAHVVRPHVTHSHTHTPPRHPSHACTQPTHPPYTRTTRSHPPHTPTILPHPPPTRATLTHSLTLIISARARRAPTCHTLPHSYTTQAPIACLYTTHTHTIHPHNTLAPTSHPHNTHSPTTLRHFWCVCVCVCVCEYHMSIGKWVHIYLFIVCFILDFM